MDEPRGLRLEDGERRRLWRRLIEAIEDYCSSVATGRVAPVLDLARIRARARRFDFSTAVDPDVALDFVVESLREHQVHTPHPRYYGLFNPAPTTMGIAADALVAAFNPQLAAWSHSPYAAEVELHVVRALGSRLFGYDAARTDGTFASGGAEANQTAVLAALTQAFADFPRLGVRALGSQPALYVSYEAHHSFHKAARLCGLGTEAVREVAVDGSLRLDVDALRVRLAEDRRRGLAPFMVVATAGTTTAGAIDPIRDIAAVAREQGLWCHADAAWGGAAALVPELRSLLDGIELTDSITFDAHKWLSVPMGAGLFLTRHPEILDRAFRVGAAYMPRDAAGLEVVDPYSHSMQWSRRFIGLKVYLSLLVAGWEGYAAAIRHQTAMGERLRERLEAAGWEVVYRTPLPLVCFVDATSPGGTRSGARAPGQLRPVHGPGPASGRPPEDAALSRPSDDGIASELTAICREVVTSGRAWISTGRVAGSRTVLRACITNYATEETDLEALVEALDEARRVVRRRAGA